MGDFETKVISTWYLENIMTGNKVQITANRSAHDVLDGLLPEQRKDWCLKYGPIENTTFENSETSKSQVTEVVFPDGTTQIFFDDSFPAERRNSPRVNLNLQAVLISGNRVFRTTTTNISMGGLLLSSKPPRDYSHPELKILISSRDGSKTLLLNAFFVESSAQTRIKFGRLNATEQAELLTWIEAGAAKQKTEEDALKAAA
jgi:hypothetical protein